MSRAAVALVPPTDEALGSLDGGHLREQAEAWESYGRPAEALRFATAAAERDPTHSDAAALAGRIATKVGDAATCDRYFRTADRFGPLRAEDYQLWIGAMVRAGAPLTVSYAVGRLLDVHGDDPPNVLFASDCYLWLAHHLTDVDGGLADRRRARDLALSLINREDLGDKLTAWLIEILGEALESRLAKLPMDRLEELAARGEGAALAYARFLTNAESYDEARAVLIQLPDGNQQARALLALLDANDEDYESALQRFDQLPEDWLARPWIALSRVSCLQGSGRLDEAAAAARSLDEQLCDAEGLELKNVRCRLQLLQAILHYQCGDFAGWWGSLARAIASDEAHGGDPELQQLVLSLRIRVAVTLDGMAVPSSWPSVEAMIAKLNGLSREDPSIYVEACADAGDRRDCSRHRAMAESAARQAFVSAKARGESDALKLGRLALLANDNQTAARVLLATAITNRTDWQALSIRALLHLRQGQASCAMNLLDEVMAQRRHDIDLRLFYCQAALHAGQVELATQEAKACHNIAPQHTQANLLLAECIHRTARASPSPPAGGTEAQHPAETGSDNIYQLAASVSHYRRAVELHEQLPVALSRAIAADPPSDLPEGVGSDVLPRAMYENALRRGAHAAILATEGLAKHRMVADRGVRRNGTYLIDQLWWLHHPCCHSSTRRWVVLKRAKHRILHRIQPRQHKTHDEARLLRWLIGSPRRHKWFAWLQSAALFLGGLLALTEALWSWPFNLGALDGTVQAALVGVAIVLLLLPAVTKVGFSGFSVERQRTVPRFPGPASMGDPLYLRDAFLMSLSMPQVPRPRDEKETSVAAPLVDPFATQDVDLGRKQAEGQAQADKETSAAWVSATLRSEQLGRAAVTH